MPCSGCTEEPYWCAGECDEEDDEDLVDDPCDPWCKCKHPDDV